MRRRLNLLLMMLATSQPEEMDRAHAVPDKIAMVRRKVQAQTLTERMMDHPTMVTTQMEKEDKVGAAMDKEEKEMERMKDHPVKARTPTVKEDKVGVDLLRTMVTINNSQQTILFD